MAVRAARERTFCRTREPAGVLEMLAWSRRSRSPLGCWAGHAGTDGNRTRNVVGKLQLAILENRSYFLE